MTKVKPRSRQRVGADGRAFAGSQRQIQEYVNERRSELDAAVRKALVLPDAVLDWRSPLKKDGYREFRDSKFLSAVGLLHLRSDLNDFWPSRGPVWDGLALFRTEDREGVLLVEAKSYPAEVRSGGCKAGPLSRPRIDNAFATAAAQLGIAAHPDWTGSLYQYANRIAYTAFLHIRGTQAYLINLCFVNDPAPERRTDREAWITASRSLRSAFGFGDKSPEWLVDVLLPAVEVEVSGPDSGCAH